MTTLIEGEKLQTPDESDDFKNAGYREAESVEELNDEIMDIFEESDELIED